jgi:hypothetical protein
MAKVTKTTVSKVITELMKGGGGSVQTSLFEGVKEYSHVKQLTEDFTLAGNAAYWAEAKLDHIYINDIENADLGFLAEETGRHGQDFAIRARAHEIFPTPDCSIDFRIYHSAATAHLGDKLKLDKLNILIDSAIHEKLSHKAFKALLNKATRPDVDPDGGEVKKSTKRDRIDFMHPSDEEDLDNHFASRLETFIEWNNKLKADYATDRAQKSPDLGMFGDDA